MRLTQIRDVLAVMESGSVRGAARKLGVSQPTVTKSIRGLEAELHAQLFGRNARGLVPTPAGRAFLARAKVAFSELQKAEEEVATAGDPRAGSVAFGSGPISVALVVPQAVARFKQQYPEARVRIVEGLASRLLHAVKDETLDFTLGMRPSTPLDPSLRFRPLFRTELVVAARKDHPLIRARNLRALAGERWISTSTLGLPGGPVERLFKSAGLPVPRAAVECESYNSVVALMAQTDMLVVMQRRMLEGPEVRPYLRSIDIEESLPVQTAGLFTRADTPLTKTAAAMARAAIAVSRELARAR